MKFYAIFLGTLLVVFAGANLALAGGDVEAGKAKAAGCGGCHGAAGEGTGDNPKIAGLDAKEHFTMLQEYKAASRGGPMMQMFAGQLSEEDMANIAAYYASLGE
jgi:cytochrome c553